MWFYSSRSWENMVNISLYSEYPEPESMREFKLERKLPCEYLMNTISLIDTHRHTHTKKLDVIKINWKLSVKRIIILGIFQDPACGICLDVLLKRDGEQKKAVFLKDIWLSHQKTLLSPLLLPLHEQKMEQFYHMNYWLNFNLNHSGQKTKLNLPT